MEPTKEVVGMVSVAYQKYTYANGYSAWVTLSSLTPYMNYVSIDTTSNFDNVQTRTPATQACSDGICLRLHNGGILFQADDVSWKFGGTASNNAMAVSFEPDGQVTDGTTNGPGKAINFALYYNGRITSIGTRDVNTCYGGGSCLGPLPALDPPWFSW